jgi:hypothetical protein
VSLLLQLGADANKLPPREWSGEMVLQWCDAQFRWFGRYRQTFAAAAIDGEAILECDA